MYLKVLQILHNIFLMESLRDSPTFLGIKPKKIEDLEVFIKYEYFK